MAAYTQFRGLFSFRLGVEDAAKDELMRYGGCRVDGEILMYCVWKGGQFLISAVIRRSSGLSVTNLYFKNELRKYEDSRSFYLGVVSLVIWLPKWMDFSKFIC